MTLPNESNVNAVVGAVYVHSKKLGRPVSSVEVSERWPYLGDGEAVQAALFDAEKEGLVRFELCGWRVVGW